MTETLAIFRSRSQAMDCMSRLRALGVKARLVNTPKEAGVGCGLSVALPQSSLAKAKHIISRVNYSAFYGYLKLSGRYGF